MNASSLRLAAILSACLVWLAHAAPPAPTISFQGRLLDPVTGKVKVDGTYTLTFSLYTVSSGGTAVWTESKNVEVNKGFFTTLLGDTTALDPTDFNRAAIWLGIRVAPDPEMVPRHRISYAPYAINSMYLDGIGADRFLRSDTSGIMTVNSTTSDALVINQASERAALRATSQANSAGEAAIQGVAVAASATSINSAAGVLGTSQNQKGVIGISDSSDGVYGWSTTKAGVSGESSNGYGLYGFSGTQAAVYAAGTGLISALKLEYRTPRVHYASITGDVFRPSSMNSTIAFSSALGQGGANFTAGTEFKMIAPVQLPHGAVVTSFSALLQDDSPSANLECVLNFNDGAGYVVMAEVGSSGSTGPQLVTDSTVSNGTINNANYAYQVMVYSIPAGNTWSTAGNLLQIKRVSIQYQISEAP